jgi:hypothetical protein
MFVFLGLRVIINLSSPSAYLFGVTVTECETIDDDRIRNCEPANCVLKYNGHRNYYNPNTKTCEKVPLCSHVNGAGLPAQVNL